MLEQLLNEMLSLIGMGVVFYVAIGAILAVPLSILGRLFAVESWLRSRYWRRRPPTTLDWYRMPARDVAWWTQTIQADAKAAAALRGTPSPRQTIQDDRGWMP